MPAIFRGTDVTPHSLIQRASRYSHDAVTGDCGTFAFALAKLLGDSAELIFFVQGCGLPAGARNPSLSELDQSEHHLRHIAVMWAGRVHDAEGEQTIEGIQDQYFRKDDDGFAVVYPATEEAARIIRNHTNFSNDWGFYFQVMQPSNRRRKKDEILRCAQNNRLSDAGRDEPPARPRRNNQRTAGDPAGRPYHDIRADSCSFVAQSISGELTNHVRTE